MNINAYLKSSKIKPASLAREIGVSHAYLSQWISGYRPIPIRHCAAIERATEGQVTRKMLRPNDWKEIWPELDNASRD